MAESITEALKDSLPAELVIFVISLLPILELRGGLIAASILQVPWMLAFPICVVGNMLPIPFIMLFIRSIFKWLRKTKVLGGFVKKLEQKAEKKKETIDKYKLFGLFLFVAIPLPGTGAWTGALVADAADIRIRKALPVMTLGVITAGVIISLLFYGIPSLFGL